MTIEKINETKNWICEKINKTDKSLARYTKKKAEMAQINKKQDVTKDITEIQRILRDYYKQTYTNNLDNL